MKYKKCDRCGANLDYGEVCDCMREAELTDWRKWFMKRFMGGRK